MASNPSSDGGELSKQLGQYGPGGREGEGRRGWKRDEKPRPVLGKLFDREPPQSLEAEMSLLGSMLLDPQVIGDILSTVKRGEDFYLEAHGAIYRVLVALYDKYHSVDLVQVVDALRDKGDLDAVGGAEYLVRLAESVPSAVNAPHYARIVAEKAKLRRLIEAAGQILYDGYHASDLSAEGAREVLDRAEMAVFEIAQEAQTNEPQRLAELLHQEIERLENSEGKGYSGVPTGFADLDGLLQGLQPGELIIVAARPSMGKTALALNMAEQIAFGGATRASGTRTPVALFSLEMSKSAVVQRLISAASGVSSQHLRSGGDLGLERWKKLLAAAQELREAHVYIDDTPNMTILQLRARARRLVAQHGVKCLMIDYLQLMSAPGSSREGRQNEVSAISRGVKALARELNVPVVCLSQLNRASEQREGNRPRMSDLRESGSIEQDADVIVLLHREEYYHTQTPDWAIENPDKVGVAELIVAKQRNGPTGVVKLTWDSSTTRFKNHAAGNIDIGYVPPPSGGGAGGGGRGYGGGGGGGGGGYDAPFDEPKPIQPRGSGPAEGAPPPPFAPGGFMPGRKTGPIENHRDGGGPDKDGGLDDLDDLPI